nr:integrase, catalytic region, zinc finger, CCHC-type, peptidase aspartic, catalytic [Tanacetum cinerariifolium]
MSTQQDVYAAGSESRPPMLNKENYVPWSSRLLRKMIPEPDDVNRDVNVSETFHLQTDNELFDKELKQIEADDQAIQTILLGLPEDIYAAVDSCETAQEIWLRVQQMMKGSDIGIQEKKAKNKHFPEKIASNLKFLNNLQPKWSRHKEVDELKAERIAKTQDPLALMANSNNPYVFLAPHQHQSSFNQNYLQQPIPNPEDIPDPTTAMNMALTLMAKAFKLNYSTPTNNNQRISSNPRNRQIAQPGMNMGQDRQIQMVGACAEGNVVGQNGNRIRCYNCRGVEEYDPMAAVVDLDEIKEVNANCILMANLQQASTSGTQTDCAPFYDTDGSAEVHENCDDNEIFNMFTQEEQYTELLEPIPESHQVPQNDNDVISEDTSVEQGGKTVEQHHVNFEETRALYESLYQNLEVEVEKVNSVNRKLKETNADLTTELARFKNQERCFEISQEKYEAAKFVGDLKYLANEADASLAKHKALELEIKRLLKGVVNIQNPLSQKLENENTELEVSVLNYAREKAHLKDTYKNLFDSIFVSRAQTKTIIASLQNELQSNIYKNAKLRTQLFKKVSDQKDNTQDTSTDTKFAKQPIIENLLKVGKTNALSNPVTSNSVSTPLESKGVNTDKVIAPGMFRITPDKTSREAKKVHNTVRASNRTKQIIVSQPPVFTRKDVNSNLNGLSSTGVDNTKTRRPQPRSNTKNDRPKVAKPKNVESHKSLATPKRRKSRLLLRWSPTGRLFNQGVKIVDSSESKSKSDCSNGDNACTSNILEPKIKRFPNSTSLIDRVYFIEGLGHNLFSVGQFYDSNLEVAFRRNACFVRNLEGVDLLKGDRSKIFIQSIFMKWPLHRQSASWLVPRPAFDNALSAFNAKMKIDLLSNPSEEHTSDWLRMVLISGLRQTMNGRTYRCVLCYRLGVPLFSVPKPCSVNSGVFVRDIYGDHVVSCTADMLLYSWDGRLDVCVDLTGLSPLTQTGMIDFVPEQAVIDATQSKRVKYEVLEIERSIIVGGCVDMKRERVCVE